jgi:hypothetical protein
LEIKKSMKRKCALGLAALLGLSGLGGLELRRTYAAAAIDMGQKCSLTVSVDDVVSNDQNAGTWAEDFREMNIAIHLYRVAAVDATGQNFTPEAPFEKVDLSDISSETTASQWLEKAEDAAKEEVLKKAEPVTAKTDRGKAEFDNLTAGMYLVAPEPAFNENYTVKYTFTPYLTVLPGNAYGDAANSTAGDEWLYDTTIGLKPQAEPLYGSLKIIKTLTNYNETLGQTTFVFEITSEEMNPETGFPQYSEVVSTTHTGPGSVEAVVEGIPAGLHLTVREVYSGASYEITGADQVNGLIVWSDAALDAGENRPGDAVEAEAEFTNDYDGGNRGGYGVLNRFTNQETGWNWEQVPAAGGE